MSPDRRQHRSAHPADEELFAESRLPTLRRATSELSWLLSRDYQFKSALKLVGDRHNLRERQRLCVGRAACSDESMAVRLARRLPAEALAGEDLIVDGFNLVITIEAALGGGVLVVCRDGCVRDLSSVHGSYRSVNETEAAVLLIGEVLMKLKPRSALWLLDRPISNSGRLAQKVGALAAARGWPWGVEVVFNPDREIVNSERIAVTSDSNVLDGAARSVNFGAHLVGERIPRAWVIDLRDPDDRPWTADGG